MICCFLNLFIFISDRDKSRTPEATKMDIFESTIIFFFYNDKFTEKGKENIKYIQQGPGHNIV